MTIKNPWPKIKYSKDQDIPDWSTVWTGVHYTKVDPFMEAADYYLLFGLINKSFVKFEPLKLPDAEEVNRAIELLEVSEEEIKERAEKVKRILSEDRTIALDGIRSEAEKLFREKVERLDGVFREYMHLAIGGELRYHSALKGSVLPANRRAAWSVWKNILDEYGIDALKSAATLFRDFNKGAYGGEPWAVACELLHAREMKTLGPSEFLSKQMFLDRVFTLEHNTGCFLNKLVWACYRSAPYNKGIKEMPKTVLAYQHSNPPNVIGLWHYASEEVQILTKNYLNLAVENDLDIMGDWKPNEAITFNKASNIQKLKEPKEKHGAMMAPSVLPKPVKVIYITDFVDFSFEKERNYKIVFKFFYNKEYLENPSFVSEYLMNAEEINNKKFFWKHMIKKSEWVGQKPDFLYVSIFDMKSFKNYLMEIPVPSGAIKGEHLLGSIANYLQNLPEGNDFFEDEYVTI